MNNTSVNKQVLIVKVFFRKGASIIIFISV